jgi:hypothetical protein
MATIGGTITNNGQPLSNQTVELTTFGGANRRATKTDAAGTYVLEQVRPREEYFLEAIVTDPEVLEAESCEVGPEVDSVSETGPPGDTPTDRTASVGPFSVEAGDRIEKDFEFACS